MSQRENVEERWRGSAYPKNFLLAAMIWSSANDKTSQVTHCEVIYTAVSQKKTPTQSFCDNFGKYRPILIVFPPLHSAMNSGRSFYITCHLTSNLLPHYLAKFECSTVHLYIQRKVTNRLFALNIDSKYLQKCHVPMDRVSVSVNL